jgi:hypothetical protein
MTGLTMQDHQIAWTTHAIGGLLMIAALIWGAVVTLNDNGSHD